jgi:hypothetical protein
MPARTTAAWPTVSAVADLRGLLDALTAGREPAELADHRRGCCALARTWLECLDSSFHRGRSASAPPAWIPQRWTWGTTPHPLHWCEIPRAGSLDCGASAALGRELWSRRCPGVRAVQLVEHHATPTSARNRDGLPQPSAAGDLAYHEAVGREQDGCLEIWDSTDSAWLPASRRGASTRTLSLRVCGRGSTILRWSGHPLDPGAWTVLDALPQAPPAAAQAPNAASAASAPAPARSQKP